MDNHEENEISKYKVTCTIEITTEAYDEDDALEIAQDCADWSSGSWYVEEIEEEEYEND